MSQRVKVLLGVSVGLVALLFGYQKRAQWRCTSSKRHGAKVYALPPSAGQVLPLNQHDGIAQDEKK
jgi:hypothetical protein